MGSRSPATPGPPMRAVRDRWEILKTKAIKGWCKVQDFVNVFGLKGRADPKHAAYKVCKRLRDNNCEVKKGEADPGVVGQPKKRVRVADLLNNYLELS